ncbi:hypothetical protein KM043_005318 [Ampulex compressa]|nr:hypothetical protein KM043_005318 [Ampulex compressa]
MQLPPPPTADPARREGGCRGPRRRQRGIDDVTKRSQNPLQAAEGGVVGAAVLSAHWSGTGDVPTRAAGSAARPNESPQVGACRLSDGRTASAVGRSCDLKCPKARRFCLRSS